MSELLAALCVAGESVEELCSASAAGLHQNTRPNSATAVALAMQRVILATSIIANRPLLGVWGM